jgi:hypothetical protein
MVPGDTPLQGLALLGHIIKKDFTLSQCECTNCGSNNDNNNTSNNNTDTNNNDNDEITLLTNNQKAIVTISIIISIVLLAIIAYLILQINQLKLNIKTNSNNIQFETLGTRNPISNVNYVSVNKQENDNDDRL